MGKLEPACELLTKLAREIEVVTAANLHRLPTANIALALRYVETTHKLDRAEQRAAASCAYLSKTLAHGCSAERTATARWCAIDAVETLCNLVAVAPLTDLAAALPKLA